MYCHYSYSSAGPGRLHRKLHDGRVSDEALLFILGDERSPVYWRTDLALDHVTNVPVTANP